MKAKHSVAIDTERCTGCGLCASDCVAGSITLRGGKAKFDGSCIACGHCEAICPHDAIELTGFEDKAIPIDGQTRLDPDELLAAIRSRRSIRTFVQKDVPEEVLLRIIEAGRYAPTAGNMQNTGYVLIQTELKACEAAAVRLSRRLLAAVKPILPPLRAQVIDDHFFFKGAPVAIVVTGNAVNAALAAQNMAFMAEAEGLGVLFSGFFTACANHSRAVRKLLNMKCGEKAVATLVLGYPGVRYHKIPRRNPAKLRRK